MGFSVSNASNIPPRLTAQTKFPRAGFPKNLPEYIYQTSTGLLIFRMKVPRDCRPQIKKNELQYSLHTRCLYSARKHIATILPFLRGVFDGIRQGVHDEDIRQFIKNGIHDAILGLPLQFTSVRQIPKPLHHSTVAPEIPQDRQPPATNDSQNKPERQLTFSNIKESFFKEKEMSQGWRLKTLEDHESVFSLFVEVFGDVPVDRIDKTLLRDFKSTIIQLPPNMRKIAKYKDKTVAEIVALKPTVTLSAHTVNKYLSRLSNLFSHGVSHGYMTVNPAGGLKVKLKSRPDEERDAYTRTDLKRLDLFNKVPSTTETLKPYCHWTPLIALYTGCRLEEIAQLHLEDIRQECGVLVFDINNKNGKNLKTLSSARLIPVHPKLIECGLIQYVYSLKTKGEQRLFPELRKQRDGYGQTVSKWFQRHKKTCGIAEGKTFHSFRHTFITHLKHKQVDPFMIHELDGHAINSETMGRYGKRYTPEILLNEAILKIDYGIDTPD